MKAVNTLRLTNTAAFFGPGPALLFEQIEETSSLRGATAACGLSYTKALRMIRDMERELGCAVVITERGGNQRGGTRLTPLGKQVLAAYREVEKELQQQAQKLVDEKFAFLE